VKYPVLFSDFDIVSPELRVNGDLHYSLPTYTEKRESVKSNLLREDNSHYCSQVIYKLEEYVVLVSDEFYNL
jgi:hypothetical protein